MAYKTEADFKKELRAELIKLKATPFVNKVFVYEKPQWNYGWIETINGDVLSIQRSCYVYQGWTLSFCWEQSRENGTGCMCTTEPKLYFTEKDIIEAALYGKCSAYKCKAKPFKSFDDYVDKRWKAEKDEIIEL